MRSLQAWGWLTAGVMALGLNGIYQDGGAAWAHQIAERVSDRADYLAESVSGRAEQFLMEARMAVGPAVTGREEATSCRLSTALARVQARMARTQVAVTNFDTMSDREQTQMDRWQASQDRIQGRMQAHINAQIAGQMARVRMARAFIDPIEVRLACPRVRVNVPVVRIPDMSIREINIPEVRVHEINIPRVRVNVPPMPAVRITAPVISVDESDSGPI